MNGVSFLRVDNLVHSWQKEVICRSTQLPGSNEGDQIVASICSILKDPNVVQTDGSYNHHCSTRNSHLCVSIFRSHNFEGGRLSTPLSFLHICISSFHLDLPSSQPSFDVLHSYDDPENSVVAYTGVLSKFAVFAYRWNDKVPSVVESSFTVSHTTVPLQLIHFEAFIKDGDRGCYNHFLDHK